MFNITKSVSPSVVDVTPMVLIVLIIFIFMLSAFVVIGSADTSKKIGKILIVFAYIAIAVSLFLNFMLIKISVNAGIEWCKNRYGITSFEVNQNE